ncbi:MAG TPA: protein-glutamate O-methyltransferase CheR [Conexibacter sp.]|nr:protein-glutamate O-methyltransferase CheR [Conexibacter sp.]
MSADLEQLADLVRDRSGIVLHGRHRIHSLAAGLAKLEPGLDAATALRRAREPVGGKAFVASLLEAVAVHETFFFRQRDDLDAIDWHALLATARASGSSAVRTWVAGCSTGEEAWTLAILATEALGEAAAVSLLATDLSAAALRRAERGRYGPRSVRHVEAGLRERYLDPVGAEWDVGEALRRLVHFRQHNLVTDPPPGERFELILCRNVLIYFDPPTVERVVRSLERVLAPGGMLVLGAADRLCRLPDPAQRRAPRAARPVAPWRARLGRPARERAPDAAPRRSWRTPVGESDAAAPPAVPPVPPVSASPAAAGPTPLAAALAAADAGRMDEAVAATERALAADPLDADAHYIRGVAQLVSGDGPAAAASLRRALYVDPGFALAAFQLGRAYDLLGDEPAARRAYQQALRTLSPDHERQQRLVASADLADVASACGARLAALSQAS